MVKIVFGDIDDFDGLLYDLENPIRLPQLIHSKLLVVPKIPKQKNWTIYFLVVIEEKKNSEILNQNLL